eukprot:TRINITY_DN16689_c0_g1_i1.p1 TRINITY_DN16689_c0_g1~~TRINITY_DN16689_c0_g1_i1.p1  ORF type:complete len:302 (+),score=46.20 TRINITY_DN16689_c0_g1_i1:138-1043(+)
MEEGRSQTSKRGSMATSLLDDNHYSAFPREEVPRVAASAHDFGPKERILDILLGGYAEFIGTCVFVFLGTGAVVSSSLLEIDGAMTSARMTLIALAFGFALTAVIYSTANYSGGHINPAVTFGLMLGRNCGIVRGLVYMFAQFLGATLASGLLRGCVGAKLAHHTNLAATTLGYSDVGQGILVEIVGTFCLMFTVLSVAKTDQDPKGSFNMGKHGPLAIGLVVAAIHFMGIPLTGASVNPARTWGPGLVSNTWDAAYVYYVGPFSGAAIAAVMHLPFTLGFKFFKLDERREAKANEDNEGL